MDTKTLREMIGRNVCNNKRLLNRRAVRYLLLIIAGLLFLNSVNDIWSISDRRAIHRQNELSRKMLDARARIQITVIQTGCRRNAFTNEEKVLIRENWATAEYTEVEEKISECLNK